MNILEAALAFAVSMLFFSMIVTTIIETLHFDQWIVNLVPCLYQLR
jgi:hypothetical protein